MNRADSAGGAHETAKGAIVPAFLCFAFAYFFSALARAITATLAPALNAELGLTAGNLGLLAGAYFLGFAAVQLPLGRALDRLGPKRVLLAFLAVAVLDAPRLRSREASSPWCWHAR